MSDLLTRAADFIRLPNSPNAKPDVLPGGEGLRCTVTGKRYPLRGGILHLLDAPPNLTKAQQSLDSPIMAWFYDRFRGFLTKRVGVPPFREEVEMTQAALGIAPGDAVLDLACGHGNFTVEWSKLAGPNGLVIGLDISETMLRRAVTRVNKAGLKNVLLVRGDALNLPFRRGSLMKLNCSGGFHQMPDLPRAIAELARVAGPGASLTTATFARISNDPQEARKRKIEARYNNTLRFIPLDELQRLLETAGFTDCTHHIPGGWFGYVSAQRT
ncbi:MAG: class I SAM-dependent methyltransferase [Candidatus Hydrogenedentes bacterium]|nr:class I SAM-dependent methyltransferase [Candidatus Hydrogenedentota bacterium]